MKIAAWFGKCAARVVIATARGAVGVVQGTARGAVEFKTAFDAEYKAQCASRPAAAPKVDIDVTQC